MNVAQQFKTMGERSTPEGRLQSICEILNDVKDEDRGRELVALFKEWKAAPSLASMLHNNSQLDVDLDDWPKHVLFRPSKSRRYGALQVALSPPAYASDHNWTIWIFASLVTNHLCEKLAGPCAKCKNYFIKKRTSQNVYCSRKCGNAATAVKRTRERIEAERKNKMASAKAAIREWRKEKPDEGWKKWVAARTKLDLRFLTRAFDEKGKPKERKVTV